ncbi:MAG: RNA methyltransferase [Gemmatimonadota bacterium]
MSTRAGEEALGRFVVVLYEPQDLVNIALVVRAMKNMGLSRLRLVRPLEFDAYRIEGIAHDTREIVARTGVCDSLDEALAGAVRVAAMTARRRATTPEWSTPAEAATRLVERSAEGDIALLFGREDRGLPNTAIDRCHDAVCIPTNPAHPSINLGQAAILVFYEIRRAAARLGVRERDLSGKPREQAPPATEEELEAFFGAWEQAMDAVGLFRGVSPTSKMRTFRRLLRRADPDQRELRLLTAAAHKIRHYAERTKKKLRDELGRKSEDDAREA